jgi:hypothetical protein
MYSLFAMVRLLVSRFVFSHKLIVRMTPEQAARHHNQYEVIDWLESASVDELKKFLINPNGNSPYLRDRAQICLTVEMSKRTRKPHWSLPWTFWVTVSILIVSLASMVFAAIAVWPIVREWFPSSPPAHKDSSSQPPQLNLAPLRPVKTQISLPATNVAPNTNFLNR